MAITQQYLKTKDAARYLGLSVSKMIDWRTSKTKPGGPKFYKSNDGIIRYKLSDLDAYIQNTLSEIIIDPSEFGEEQQLETEKQ